MHFRQYLLSQRPDYVDTNSRNTDTRKENMTPMNRRARFLVVIAIVVLVIIGVVEMALPHLGFFWHLANKSEVAIDGHSFVVPSKYFLSRSDGRLALLRLSPVVPLISKQSDIAGPFARQSIIGIYTHKDGKNFDKDADYLRLKEWLTNESKQAGLILESERTLSTPIGTAYCFQFNSSQVAEVRCFLEGSKITVFFDGEPRFASDVYAVVSGASRVN